MIVISHYTANGRYPALAHRLAASCNRFDLRHNITQVADVGDWKRILHLKPHTIIRAMMDHRAPVLWCDADCEFKKLPSLFFGGPADFAIYNFCGDPNSPNYDPARLQAAAGVVYFGYTAPALELLIRWIEAAKSVGTDDDAMNEAFNSSRPPVRPLWLPASYNRMDAIFPSVDPVINHEYAWGQHGQAEAAPRGFQGGMGFGGGNSATTGLSQGQVRVEEREGQGTQADVAAVGQPGGDASKQE